MDKKKNANDLLIINKLNYLENRLRRIELLILRTLRDDKSIRKQINLLEKEESMIEKEQKKLEKEEFELIKDIKTFEGEEKWDLEIRFGCHAKFIQHHTMFCAKSGKVCEFLLCPLVKK
jgi:hypothetical protein